MWTRFFRSRRPKTVDRTRLSFRPHLEDLETRLVPATVNWINPGGGDWFNPLNWQDSAHSDQHYVPGAGDSARIRTLNPRACVTYNGSDTVADLGNPAQCLILQGGTLTILNPQGEDSDIVNLDVRNGATLRVANGGLETSFGGDHGVTVSGTLDAAAGATITLGGHLGDGTDLNAGAVLTGDGQFVAGNTATVNVNAPMTLSTNFRVEGTLVATAETTAGANFTLGLLYSGTLTGPADFLVPDGSTMTWNSGSITGTGNIMIQPGGTLNLSPVGGKVATRPITNDGTVNAQGGFNATSTCIFTNAADGTFNINNAADISFLYGGTTFGTFENLGTLTKTGTGQAYFYGSFSNDGYVTASSGTLAFSNQPGNTSTSTFDAEAGSTIQFDHYTFNDGTALTTQDGTGLFRIIGSVIANTDLDVALLELSSGNPDLELAGTLTIDNTLNFLEGKLGSTPMGMGHVVIPEYATMNVANGPNSGGKNFGDLVFDNYGTTNINDAAFGCTAHFQFTNQGTVVIVVMDISDNPQINFGTFSNLGGSFSKTGAGQVRTGATSFSNDGGYVRVLEGTLYFYGSYVQTDGTTEMAAGATLSADGGVGVDIRGGVLTGSGTIIGNVTNSGYIAVGGSDAIGTLTIQGNYTQTAAGTLSLDLGGTDPGTYDQLVVTRQVTLGGTLMVNYLGDYMPNSGDSYRVLTFGSRQGDFATLNMPPELSNSYDASGLTLSAN